MNKTDRRSYLVIVVLFLAVMLAVANLPFKVKPFGDITFHAEAKTLALFLKGQVPAELVAITKAPGPVLFFTPAYLLAPNDAPDETLWYFGVAMSTVLVCMAMVLVFKTVKKLFGLGIAWLTIALFAVFPIHCYYSLGIVAEVPAFFSLTLGLYGWILMTQNPSSRKALTYFILGFLGLLLNRPNAMLFLPLVVAVLGGAYIWRREYFKRYARPLLVSVAVIFVVGFGILSAAKSISRQGDSQDNLLYYVAHQGRFQFREEPLNFNFWDNDFRDGTPDYDNWKKSNAQLHQVMKAENRTYADVFRQWLIDDAVAHPFWFLRQSVIKAFYGHIYFINSVSPKEFKMGPFNGRSAYYSLLVAVNVVNLLILMGVAVYLLRDKIPGLTWPFWGIWVVLIAFHAVTYMEPRYLFPAKAALYPLSAAGLYQIGFVRRSFDRFMKFFNR